MPSARVGPSETADFMGQVYITFEVRGSRFNVHVIYRNLKLTRTVMTTGTGVPLSSVGV